MLQEWGKRQKYLMMFKIIWPKITLKNILKYANLRIEPLLFVLSFKSSELKVFSLLLNLT